ncbi:hypothetical protein JYB64_19795 [Algoriphagus aestuarii]|nr:hypothetical protein [Algoriphagus aestuarii]
MKISTTFKVKILAFLVLAGILVACESTEKETENVDEILSLDEEEEKKLLGYIQNGLNEKSDWKSHWSELIGSIDASDFNLIQSDTIDPMEMPEKNPILPGDPLFPYQIPNPAGNGTMDIYSYKIEAQEGLDSPFLNPDSEVIWYREDGMKERLLFMGPSGMFEEGLWMDAETFLVFGYFQEEAGFRPMAWVIELDTHQVHRYQLERIEEEYDSESYLNQKIKKVDLS